MRTCFELTVGIGHADLDSSLVKEEPETEVGWQVPTVSKEACFEACAAVQLVPTAATRRSKRARLAHGFSHDDGFCSAALSAAA